jgi:plastocyanin
MRKVLLVALVAALALAAVGCGSSKKSSTTTSGAASAPAASTGGGASSGKTANVTMKNIAFNPATITVAKGTTVVWTNDDSVNHDVTKSGGPGPNFASGSGNLSSGDTYKQTFNTPGTITYRCTIHPGMEGKIVVK